MVSLGSVLGLSWSVAVVEGGGVLDASSMMIGVVGGVLTASLTLTTLTLMTGVSGSASSGVSATAAGSCKVCWCSCAASVGGSSSASGAASVMSPAADG